MDYYKEITADFIRKTPVDLSKSDEFITILRMILDARKVGKPFLKTTMGKQMVEELRERGFQMTSRGGDSWTVSWREEN